MSANAHGNFSGKRLVIFGCGYVGSAVARAAVARGMKLTALTRNEGKAAVLRAGGAEVVVGDLAGDSWHDKIDGGAEFVLNCVSSGGGGVEGYRHSYVQGMASVLAWSRTRGNAGTLVYTSSTSVYPQGDGARVDETAMTGGAGERADLLLEAERALSESSGACRRWFVLRLAGIYGPGRHGLLDQTRAGEIAGTGLQHLNLIHLDDICSAIWAAFGADLEIAGQILNVADDGATPKSEITAWLAACLNVPPPRYTGAATARRGLHTPDRIIANDRIKRVLGWSPRHPTFREGYAEILRTL